MGDSGIFGFIRLRTSITLRDVLNRVMGLYELTCVGSLIGLRVATLMPCFQVSAILHCE